MSCALSVPSHLLPHKVDIESCQQVKDSVGTKRLYPPEGGTKKKTDLACLIDPLGTEKVVEFANLGWRTTHRLYFAESPGLTTTDRIVYGDRKFEARGETDVAELGKLFVVNAEEVK